MKEKGKSNKTLSGENRLKRKQTGTEGRLEESGEEETMYRKNGGERAGGDREMRRKRCRRRQE